MKLLNFSIIKLTIALIIGVLIGYYYSFSINISLSLTLLFSVSFIGLHFYSINKLKRFPLLDILVISTIVCIGILNTTLHKQSNFNNHYSYLDISTNESNYTIDFRVREVLKPGNYYNKYVINILKVNDSIVTGKTLLNVKKDSTIPSLKVDNIYYTKTQFKSLIHPLNPHQFDYKEYLRKQHIYHQLFVSNNELLLQNTDKHTIFGYAAALRENINSKLKAYNFKESELAIINALLLGQRQDISKEIYNSYTKAGAIHILAVSGLHVGIILFLLNYLLKPIEYFKKGYLIKLILTLIFMWSYAVIAGLSASVVRAVTMFSVFAFAMHLKRKTNVYNTLAISIFILLLFKPNFLFDVGFQLSYLAVLAIIIIQPMLYNLYKPKFKVIDFFWKIFTVTIAAQFGIIPISLYYFHQFPGLFVISNLVIIPCLSIILGAGILLIVLSLINALPTLFAEAYGFIISTMNNFVSWISEQETYLFQNISFSLTQVILSYIVIISGIACIKTKTYKSTLIFFISIIIFQGYFMSLKFKTDNSFVVFHKSRYTIIGQKLNNKLIINHNIEKIENEKLLTNYKIGEHIDTINYNTIKNLYTINNIKILVIDSLGIYNIKSIKPNIILLRDSPKLNLNRVIDSLQPELIISDGSNYKSYQERWKETCRIKKLPFHQTSKKGAFVISY
ncbi:ComEC/Rec2 family competence protein [Pontimicrobium sp. IMCC45349]|uniref:ComEC/Rec2 family competence protein n=1 Tax=Pontimicrobium sp. IMCC45349 TaxID=3391574 RepID=UPI0039A10851